MAECGGDAGGPDGVGEWLIWWLEGAKQSWAVAALFLACYRPEKDRGEETWVDHFLSNLLMDILVGCCPNYG